MLIAQVLLPAKAPPPTPPPEYRRRGVNPLPPPPEYRRRGSLEATRADPQLTFRGILQSACWRYDDPAKLRNLQHRLRASSAEGTTMGTTQTEALDRHEPHAPATDAELIQDDLSCIGCAYNLHGLPVDRPCPECGKPAMISVRAHCEGLHSIPWSLRLVGILFLLVGVISLADLVATIGTARLRFDPAVIGIFVGVGLLKLSRVWRVVALITLSIVLVFLVLMARVILRYGGIDTMQWGNEVWAIGTPAVFLFGLAAVALLILWQFRVLLRRDVRMLFKLGLKRYGCPAGLPDVPREAMLLLALSLSVVWGILAREQTPQAGVAQVTTVGAWSSRERGPRSPHSRATHAGGSHRMSTSIDILGQWLIVYGTTTIVVAGDKNTTVGASRSDQRVSFTIEGLPATSKSVQLQGQDDALVLVLPDGRYKTVRLTAEQAHRLQGDLISDPTDFIKGLRTSRAIDQREVADLLEGYANPLPLKDQFQPAESQPGAEWPQWPEQVVP